MDEGRARILGGKLQVGTLNYLSVSLLSIYAFCMFVFPLFDGHWSWEHLQRVWDRWQTLNAAALAFVASLLAFNIANLSEERQREREFIAAKSFLPEAFSNLMEYIRLSANIYVRLWETEGRDVAGFAQPVLPDGYREVFSNCIRHANPAVGAYLANFLVLLQVHDARLRQVFEQVGNGQDRAVARHNVLTYLFRTGELYALLSKQFDFARGEGRFNASLLSWEEFRNAYGILRILCEQIYMNSELNLEAFTRRRIARALSAEPENEQ